MVNPKIYRWSILNVITLLNLYTYPYALTHVATIIKEHWILNIKGILVRGRCGERERAGRNGVIILYLNNILKITLTFFRSIKNKEQKVVEELDNSVKAYNKLKKIYKDKSGEHLSNGKKPNLQKVYVEKE